MTRWLKFAALPVLLALGYLAGSVVAGPGLAGPGGGGGQESCLPRATDKTADDPGDLVTVIAGTGQVITALAIKARSENQLDQGCFSYTEDELEGPCYTVEGLGTATVRIERIGSGSGCNEISHVEWTTTPGITTTTTTTTSTDPKTSTTPATTDRKTTSPTS